MAFNSPLQRLPQQVIERASLRGNEYAWPVSEIPAVIEAARSAGLVNVGGQLQFHTPDGGTCECYWVEVDTYKSVPKDLPWNERVTRTAEVALADFVRLRSTYDFLAEGRRAFDIYLRAAEQRGVNPAETMCLVWYLLGPEEANRKNL